MDTPASLNCGRRNLIRRWIAILCVSLFVFTGLAHSTCVHFTADNAKLTSTGGADTGDSDDNTPMVGAGHCFACAAASLAVAEPALMLAGAAAPLIWAQPPVLRSNHQLFDTPPPKSLT